MRRMTLSQLDAIQSILYVKQTFLTISNATGIEKNTITPEQSVKMAEQIYIWSLLQCTNIYNA